MADTSTTLVPSAGDISLQRKALRIIKGTGRFEDRFFPDHAELIELINMLRSMGCIVVLTMGTWDLKHLGHEDYIEHGKDEAAKLYPDADHVVMVAAVDTDELTRGRKGPKRPFVPQPERVKQIYHVRSVDIVTLEYNLRELPPKLPHDVRIISESTNDPEKLAEQQKYCTHLINLPPQLNDSSSARLRRLALEGKIEAIEKVEKGLVKLLADLRNEE